MTAAAAAHGLGVALVPRLLVDAELARGALVVACTHRLPGARFYHLVMPERTETTPALGHFCTWLLGQARDEAATQA